MCQQNEIEFIFVPIRTIRTLRLNYNAVVIASQKPLRIVPLPRIPRSLRSASDRRVRNSTLPSPSTAANIIYLSLSHVSGFDRYGFISSTVDWLNIALLEIVPGLEHNEMV